MPATFDRTMALLTTASQAAKAVKNVGRLREIVTAMSRFGFGAAVEKVGLARFRMGTSEDPNRARQPVELRLRLLLEELGPAFIKVGQVLAGRPDLIPLALVKELEKLQDQVSPINFEAIRTVVENDLQRTLSEAFASFDAEPLAIASIAQVHAARTHEGQSVVVKVKKPDVEKSLSQDLEIIEMIAALLERSIPELRGLHPTRIVTEFRKALMLETNFILEASNIRRYRQNFAQNSFLVVPQVYDSLSGANTLTLDRLYGTKLSDADSVRAMGVDPKEILKKGMDCFFQSMLVDGFFHGDPHGGNILVLPDGRLGLIDFGCMGRLTPKARDAVVDMFIALLTQDFELLVLVYLEMSEGATPRNSALIAELQKEVADLFAPYFGLPLKSIPTGKLLMEASGTAFRHQISVPRDLILVFKAIMTLEGIGRSLDPEFDLVEAASKYTSIVLKTRYAPDRIGKDLLFTGREFARFIARAPRQVSEILRQLENGDFNMSVSVKENEKIAQAEERGLRSIASAVLASGAMIAAVMAAGSTVVPPWAQITIGALALSFAVRVAIFGR